METPFLDLVPMLCLEALMNYPFIICRLDQSSSWSGVPPQKIGGYQSYSGRPPFSSSSVRLASVVDEAGGRLGDEKAGVRSPFWNSCLDDDGHPEFARQHIRADWLTEGEAAQVLTLGSPNR